ncbi:hypothetical protein F8273_08230 [Bifidobacterium bifidum]|nr:hypothetical protein F8273_08230 [Bifidobacterium bifidum]
MPIEPKRRCVPKCAPERQVREHTDANGPVCVPMCARSSFRRALRNAKRGEDLGRGRGGRWMGGGGLR